MKRFFLILWSLFTGVAYVRGFTWNIDKTSYTFEVDEIFPSPQSIPAERGIDNVIDYIVAIIPLLTTLMAVWAVLMVIYWGFQMVLGWAQSEQTEKGKSIIKDAILGLLFGLMAYVVITTLWNILDI